MKLLIFNKNFLQNELEKFQLNYFPNIRLIKASLESWIEQIEAGRVDATKETAQNAEFARYIFENALGYNAENSYEWNLKREKKSEPDGTTCDIALGYFHLDEKENKSIVVVELKDSNTNLDEKQKRKDFTGTP